MLVYDRAFNEIRVKYILPLSKFSVPYKSLKNINIRSIIYNELRSVTDFGNNEYLLHYDQDILLKSILGEIELFYIRTILQKEDTKVVDNPDITPNWNIVTNYYHLFFNASLLLRLFHRGTIYLEKELKIQLQELISVQIGIPIKLQNNQFFEIINYCGELVIKITSNNDSSHELVWKKVDMIIDELLLLSVPNSDEQTILKSLKNINVKLSCTFPSQLRNRVNYQPLYGIACIERKLFPFKPRELWLGEILNFDFNEAEKNDNKIVDICTSYGNYIEIFCQKLIFEYFNIRGNENGILKKINENRDTKIISKNHPFSFDIR